MKKRLAGIFLLLFLLVSTAFSVQKWWQDAVFYQIFPLSFYDTDATGKGDLNGITSKLDYLKELGITGIWLTPINTHPKSAYHGYAVDDYYAIDPTLGTMKDFENLIATAHKKGIKIVMDLVMNHTSSENPWFKESAKSSKSPYANWYIWEKEPLSNWANASGNSSIPAWNKYTANTNADRYNQYFYAAFNFKIPDLNHTNPAVKKEFQKIAKFWLDKGVDGFRIDAARYLIETGPKAETDTPETIAYLTEFAKYVKSVNPDAYVIGEVYAGLDTAKKYYSPEGMDAVFNFDFSGPSGTVRGTVQVGRTRSLIKSLNDIIRINKAGVPYTYFAPFFSNHDAGRFSEAVRYQSKVQTGIALLLTLPGAAPYIYYGDEIGEREGYNLIGDAKKRNPMYWDSSKHGGFSKRKGVWVRKMKKYYTNDNVAAQMKNTKSTWHIFQKLIRYRKTLPALYEGEISLIDINKKFVKKQIEKSSFFGTSYEYEDVKSSPIVAYWRSVSDQKVLVLVNAGKHDMKIDYTLTNSLDGWKLKESFDNKSFDQVPQKFSDNLLKTSKIQTSLKGLEFMILIFQK